MNKQMTAPAFDTALDLLSRSKDPVADILRTSAYWIPLQFVYVQFVRNKELIALSDLPKHEKSRLWAMTDSSWEQWKRITVCQAIYVYESLTLPG